MTTTPQIKIVNVVTGEEIVRDATSTEITQMQKDAANYKEQLAEAEAKANAKAALLTKLGITAEEATLLLS